MNKKYMPRAIELMKEILAPEGRTISEMALQLETLKRLKDFVNQKRNHNILIMYCEKDQFDFYIGIINNDPAIKDNIDYEIKINERFTDLVCFQINGKHKFEEEI